MKETGAVEKVGRDRTKVIMSLLSQEQPPPLYWN